MKIIQFIKILLFFLFAIFLSSCNSKNEKKNVTLIEGLNLDTCLFEKKDISLKKYKYNNTFIEDIKMSDLLNTTFRDDFFKYLEKNSGDDGTDQEFKPSLFTQLLLIRIEQFEDINAYFLLKESSKKTNISYNGIELYNQYLWTLFLDKSTFFITESNKYNDSEILEYILNDMSKEFLKTTNEIKDPLRMCDCSDIQSGMILLSKEKLKTNQLEKFNEKFKNVPIIKIDCSPTFETRKNTTEEYYDIKSIIDKEFESKLGIKEKVFYKLKVLPIMKDYIFTKKYTIDDADGFTNLRKESNAKSEILEKVTTRESVEFISQNGDWFLVLTKSGHQGYVFKTKIKSE
jgi:hypothetical protein